MKTQQPWFWPGTKRSIDLSLVAKALIAPLLCVCAIVVAPLLPATASFGVALAALLLGPAWNMPALLFPRGYLSVPESLLIIVLGSIFIDVCMFFILNALGLQLTPDVIGIVVVTSSSICGVLALVRQSFTPRAAFDTSGEQHWLAFACGVGVALTIALIVYRF